MFDLTVQLQSTNSLLERIAYALERIAGPVITQAPHYTPRGPESIVSYGDTKKQWLRNTAMKLVREKGLAAEDQKSLVDQVMGDYERAEREGMLPPEDLL